MTSPQKLLLDMQADRIEMVLQSHRVAGRVWGGTVAARCVTFDVSPTVGTNVHKVANLSEEIALALGVARCRVYRQEGGIKVEVPTERGETVRLPALLRRLPAMPPLTAALGVDRRGSPLLVHLESPDIVHVLVAGTTGSGKTELLRSVVASLALLNRQSDCQFLLVDPKWRGLAPFAGLPHLLRPPVSDLEEAEAALEDLTIEMERRDRGGISRPGIVLVIDELADLLLMKKSSVEENVTRLVQRGRGAGVHVVAATQKPAASVIGPLIRSNFPMRIVGRVVSAQDALAAAGVGGSHAERLLGKGDMLAVARGTITRFQAAYASDADLGRLVQALQRRSGPPQLLDAGARPTGRSYPHGREIRQ